MISYKGKRNKLLTNEKTKSNKLKFLSRGGTKDNEKDILTVC